MVIGGSPCQAFSVAGRRESLADHRGNLTLSFVEAVNAIDPKFILWENVPGVLSVKDNIFGRFLAALAGCRSPIVPPRGRKWPNAGMAVGPRRSLAWRVLDAQFFGIPQRRRRVFLVACPRSSGFDPGEILFEREGLRGHPPQGGKAWQDVDGIFTSRSRSGGWSHDADLAAAGYIRVAKCLTSKNQRIDLETETLVAGTLCASGAGTERPAGQANEPDFLVAHTLRGEVAEAAPKQTLAEFKKEFSTFVDSLPVHPSQAGAWKSISIHDNVFEKMMNDPEYKAEVEDMVRGQLAQDFVFPPAYSTMRLDANGEYWGTAGGSFHMDKFGKESADAFWKKEPARKTAGNDDDSFWNRKAKDKAAKKKEDERKLLEQLIGERRLQREYLQDVFANKTGYGGYSAATAAPPGQTFTSILDSLI